MSENTIRKRQNIGPSHFKTILGYDSFKTPEDLKAEIEVGFTEMGKNPAMEMGISKENEVIQLYESLRNVKVKKAHWIRSGRILAKADGLIGNDGGIEIKCHYGKKHALSTIPIFHLVQILGYLHLYKREWWDLVSCCFDEDGKIQQHRIHRVYWNKYGKSWLEFWFPQIQDFIKTVKWDE